MLRWIFYAVRFLLFALISIAAIAAPVSPETQKNTYLFGIRCYVANAVAATDQRYNADGSHTATFKANGAKAYDAIWYFGRAIGNSDDLIREDIDSYKTLYSKTFLQNDAFFQQTRRECTHIGLM